MSKKIVSGITLTLLLGMLILAFGTQNFSALKVHAYNSSGTPVGGYISENTTWTLEYSPYIVLEDVIVEPGVCLIIEAGVLVKFKEGKNLIVDGFLLAKGNLTHQIVFTSDSENPVAGDWGTIRFRRNVNRFLDWVIIKFADKGISIENGTIVIENSVIVNNNLGISIMGGYSVTIRNSSISQNTGHGLFVKGSSVLKQVAIQLEEVSVIFNGGTGIFMDEDCIAVISRSAIVGNYGHGIRSPDGGFDNCYILNSTIAENGGNGLHQHGWSWYTWYIEGSTIVNNYGAGIYREPEAYNIYVSNSTIRGNTHSGISGHIGGYIRYSNIYYNFPYDYENSEGNDVDATYNWWGTINETLIQEYIYDYYDDYSLGRVLFKPFLTAPARVPDDIPPITSDNYDGLWHNTDFTITLTATDHESGAAETYYRINGGPVKAVSVDGQPVITTEGANNTLEYWSVDYAGNEESHKFLTGIKLDKTSPLITSHFRFPDDNVEPNEPVKVAVNVTDFLSDVKNCTVSYRIAGESTWINIPMTLNQTTMLYEAFIQIQEPNVEVEYRIIAYDNAGNVALEDNNGQYYTYTVIPEFPSITILLLMLIVLSTIVSVKRKVLRRKFPT